MSTKLLGSLCLLLVLLCPSWAEQQQQKCPAFANGCDVCIKSGPACAWCTTRHAKARCHTLRGLRRAGCPQSHIYNPQNKLEVVRNDSSTEPGTISLQPQELSLRLRPGVSQSFPFTVTMPADQPITELVLDTTPLPSGVNMTFSNITNGNRLTVQVTVEVARCPREGNSSQPGFANEPWRVHIVPRGYLLIVKLAIHLECQCNCKRKLDCWRISSTKANGNENLCRSARTEPVCNNRGTCVEGSCECEKRVKPEEMYSGHFCECSNFDCSYHNGRLCGGHGVCECGQCRCHDAWTGEACSCSMETASCMSKDQNLCSNRGTCQCGGCRCEEPYRGRTCEDSPF